MKIGKYEVVAHVDGTHEGGFRASLTRSWMEGGEKKELLHTIDKVFGTMELAHDRAYEHARIQVDEGVW